MHQIITVLQLGLFADSLCMKPTKDMEKFRQIAAQFIQVEER